MEREFGTQGTEVFPTSKTPKIENAEEIEIMVDEKVYTIFKCFSFFCSLSRNRTIQIFVLSEIQRLHKLVAKAILCVYPNSGYSSISLTQYNAKASPRLIRGLGAKHSPPHQTIYRKSCSLLSDFL